jgi:hypothetical protein
VLDFLLQVDRSQLGLMSIILPFPFLLTIVG